MISKIKEKASAAGIEIKSFDDSEIVFSSRTEAGHEVRFVHDSVIISFAAGFSDYGFDPEKDNEVDKMQELEDVIRKDVDTPLDKKGYALDRAEVIYGVDNPDFRVMTVDYYKDVKGPDKAVNEIKWALKMIDGKEFSGE